MNAPTYASPVDTETYGEYRIVRDPADPRPLYRFSGRITEDGTSPFTAELGRFHIYAGWFCPWAQRTVIQRSLRGLEDVVSVSYVDGARDGRGWAFRETNGADPVNGFTLLREAYDATEPGFDGHISVPTLWDRTTGTVASNDFRLIGIDLATQFEGLSNGVSTYPAEHAAQIEELDSWIGPAVNQGVQAAAQGDAAATAALLAAFERLDGLLAERRYLVGDRVTEADVRLYVTLARFDAQSNAARQIVSGLDAYPHLWAYARDLYEIPAFRDSTRFSAFTAPGALVPDWSEPHGRDRLFAAA
jgi:putative glutathione S-transferase